MRGEVYAHAFDSHHCLFPLLAESPHRPVWNGVTLPPALVLYITLKNQKCVSLFQTFFDMFILIQEIRGFLPFVFYCFPLIDILRIILLPLTFYLGLTAFVEYCTTVCHSGAFPRLLLMLAVY